MIHNREEVIDRTIREFEALDALVAHLSKEQWKCKLVRPESKDPWTVKDALAHITYWKAGVARTIRRQRRPPGERGMKLNETNHLVYMTWRNSPPEQVLAWHRQVHENVLAVLREAPEEWYSSRERGVDWPGDLDGHSRTHRIKDIEKALKENAQ
jgi:hypothetical protein